jgi:hypothetical protein
MQNTTTYNKLRDGSWGIRSTVAITAGQTVTVTKRDGGSKLETVGKVVWSGNGVWLATVVASRPERTPSISYRGGRRTGCSCGSREDRNGNLIPSSRNCAQCEYDAE